jgi:tetratricopeptide (TPR) repeat protein/transcriptional regulator with XRE-family HTH domain
MAAAAPRPFGAVLKRYRQAAGLTQEALAGQAGLSIRTISDLERGLKTRPHPDTVARLAAALRLAPAEQAALLAARQGTVPAALGPALPPFVGRSRELVLLEQHLAGAGPPLLLLSGEPGIGKSRLLHEARQRAGAQGLQVLAGGCQRHSAQLPYAPLLPALERHLHALTPTQLRCALAGCAWLVRLLPELAHGPIEPLPAWTLPPAQERRLLFAAVARLLGNVAGPQGTLLLLDDLQWADPDALALLASLLHSEAPVRVLGAYRDTEAQPQTALATAVADLAQAGRAAQHSLGPLAAVDAAHLLAALCLDVDDTLPRQDGWAEQRALVLQRAGGVPFVLVSYAQVLREGVGEAGGTPAVPWDVAQGVRQRVAALPALAQELLAIVAVLGREAPRRLLPLVAGAAEEAVVPALEAACRARLLEETEQGYRFAHDVIAEVVEAELSGLRRRLLHRRVAGALEQQPGAVPVEALAYHYTQGELPERALPYLVQAGDRAQGRYGYEAAEGYYRAAVSLLDERGRGQEAAEVREKLGRTLRAAGRYEAALEVLEEAAGTYEAAGDVEGQARTVAEIGRVYYAQERAAEGRRRLQPLAAALEGREASPGLAALVVVLAALGVRTGSGWPEPEKVPLTAHAVAVARAVGEEALLAEALYAHGLALLRMARRAEALPVMEQAAARAETAGALDVLSLALAWLGALYISRREAAPARQYLDRALEVAERLDDPNKIMFALQVRGQLAGLSGDWSQEHAALERAVLTGRRIGMAESLVDCLRALGGLYLYEGRWQEAERYLDESLALAEQSGHRAYLPMIQSAWAERDLLAGQPERAYARLAPLLDATPSDPATETGRFADWLRVRLAWAQLERGEVAQAAELAAATLQRIREHQEPEQMLDALRVQAMVLVHKGHWAAAADALAEGLALAQAPGFPYPFFEARFLHVRGQLHLNRGEPAAARERLEAALAIFQRLGAHPFVAQVEQDLAALEAEASARGAVQPGAG